MSTILTAVRDFLESKSAIRHLSFGKIFYDRAPQGTAKPYVLINRVAVSRFYTLSNETDAASVVVQVDVYHTEPNEMEKLAEAIRLAMSGTQNVFWGNRDAGGIYVFSAKILREDVNADRPQDASDRWSYNFSRDYDITHREPVPTH